MDGNSIDMRGRDAGRRGDRHGGAIRTRLTYEFVKHVGLTGTGRTGQKDVRAGAQNRKSLFLPHIAPPSPPSCDRPHSAATESHGRHRATAPPRAIIRQSISLSTTLSTPRLAFDGAR